MNREMIILAIAYSYVISGSLSDKQREILENNNIDFKVLNEYIDKINNNRLSINEQDTLEKMFNIDLSKLNNTNSEESSKSNSKQMVKSNGNIQLFNNDEAAFSDIYLFGFLVLVFQVLFLIISYIIFSR